MQGAGIRSELLLDLSSRAADCASRRSSRSYLPDFDSAVQRGLREIVDFLGVDRGGLINAKAAQRLLAVDMVDLEKVCEILSDIVADDKRAAAVISGLRGLLKKGEPEFVPLDLNEIVGAVAWLMRSDTVMRNVSMSLELAPDLPSARGDRVQLQQVVLNLVLNSLEAMREPQGARTLVIHPARDGPAAPTP